MPKLSDLLAETATTELDVGGLKVHLTYYVLWDARISEEDWARFKPMPVREYWAEMLGRILKEWDLVDDDGQPVPITLEAFDKHEVPNRLLAAISDAVQGSVLAGKANGTR